MKKNIPKKGAAKKVAEKLKQIGSKKPPKEIVDSVIKQENPKEKVARPYKPSDLEL